MEVIDGARRVFDCWRNQKGPYFKTGIHHAQWKSFHPDKFRQDTATTRPIVACVDGVCTVQGQASYKDVASH